MPDTTSPFLVLSYRGEGDRLFLEGVPARDLSNVDLLRLHPEAVELLQAHLELARPGIYELAKLSAAQLRSLPFAPAPALPVTEAPAPVVASPSQPGKE